PRIDDDSSGVLRYVRIEFPGVNLTGISGNEINGLTMGGVGSRTVIDYVQVSYSGDDSYEWFGGTVNCKYLIAYKGLDDDWDTDNGFRGKIQFGLSVRDTGLVDISTSNGFESDNNANSPTNFNGPRTRPVFSNMTVVGPFFNTGISISTLWGRGAHERRNSLMSLYNSIVMGWRVGYRFDGSGVYNAASSDTIQIRNTIFGGNVKLADTVAPASFSAHLFLQNAAYNNTVFSTAASVQLNNPFAIYPEVPLPADNVSNWLPSAGSPALSGADFSNPNLGGFENVSYRGAFGTANWTYEWAQFNPINYTIPVTSNYFITVAPQGFYNTGLGRLNMSDTVRAYLRQTSAPFSIVDSARALVDAVSLTGKFNFIHAPSGTFYIQLQHRNSIRTWSKNGGEPFTSASDNFYNFTSSVSQAFGSNQIVVGPVSAIYSGDVNQNDVIDLSDLLLAFNDAQNFATGYVNSDVNGTGVVDLSDLLVIFNNAQNFVTSIRP
ncbi:MAG: hypothetical protein ABI462_11500, partial [Ignavibacteria bacterium]